MALTHVLPAEAVDVLPLGARLATEKTVALFKSDDLEVIRLVLLAGKSFREHKLVGEVTLHCIEGALVLQVGQGEEGSTQLLHAGQLLYLPGGAPHAITALEDTSALLTIVVRK